MSNFSRSFRSRGKEPAGTFQFVAVLTLGLILAAAVPAQYRPNVVFWSDKQGCGSKKITVGAQDQYSCRTESQGRHGARVIEAAGLKISILPGRTTRFVTLLTRTDNKGTEELVLDFSKWSVAHYVSGDEFLAGKPPIVNEESIDPGAPAKNGTVKVTPSANPFPTAETRTVDKRSSASSPTIVNRTVPQTVIAPTTGNVGVSNFPNVTVTGTRVSTGVEGFKTTPLRVNSVQPKGSANGMVYFGRVEESGYQLAIVHIGDTTFVFEID